MKQIIHNLTTINFHVTMHTNLVCCRGANRHCIVLLLNYVAQDRCQELTKCFV
jgi:hypothetical protein